MTEGPTPPDVPPVRPIPPVPPPRETPIDYSAQVNEEVSVSKGERAFSIAAGIISWLAFWDN